MKSVTKLSFLSILKKAFPVQGRFSNKRPGMGGLIEEIRMNVLMVKWVKVFKNGPSKTSRRQPLKNLK